MTPATHMPELEKVREHDGLAYFFAALPADDRDAEGGSVKWYTITGPRGAVTFMRLGPVEYAGAFHEMFPKGALDFGVHHPAVQGADATAEGPVHECVFTPTGFCHFSQNGWMGMNYMDMADGLARDRGKPEPGDDEFWVLLERAYRVFELA